jgi:putative Mn2+ efflux pump MntP
VLRLLAFVLPLGLDSFAVAVAIGAAGRLTAAGRWRIVALFLVFEAGAPLIGLALGAPLADAVGDVVGYLAPAMVIAVGAWMLLQHEDEDGEKVGRLAGPRVLPREYVAVD